MRQGFTPLQPGARAYLSLLSKSSIMIAARNHCAYLIASIAHPHVVFVSLEPAAQFRAEAHPASIALRSGVAGRTARKPGNGDLDRRQALQRSSQRPRTAG